MKKKIGIYIHIPFCVKKCLYCDFASFPLEASGKMDAYIQALLREMKEYEVVLKEYEADTVFIGGGTPSLLSGKQMQTIFDGLGSVISIRDDAEISMEMNPGTIQKERLLAYKEAGINRVSVGLQSANDEELKRLGRIHNYEQFLENFHLLRECGFENINVDLMSGLPYQNMEIFRKTLGKVVDLKPEHLSVYSLIVEEGTPFYQSYGTKEGEMLLPGEELDRQMYAFTKSYLEEQGYNRYEVSNYAKEGYECRHNLKYWQLEEYLGFGLAAASLFCKERYVNVAMFDEYINDTFRKEQREVTTVSEKDEMEEFMFLGLRTMKGVSKRLFAQHFGIQVEEVYGDIIGKYTETGFLQDGDFISLTEKGIDVSNVIMSEFLL